ncbi:hypothetical protein Tco_1181047 [Tanacetum coccineum]
MGNGRRCARMWLGFVECLLTSCVGGLRVEPETKITSKRHFLTMKPKWMDSEVLNFLTDRKIDKRYKTSDSISFNTESRDSSVNLNVDAKGDEEDEVQEVAPRLMGRDKAKKLKKKRVGSSGTSSTMNDKALASPRVDQTLLQQLVKGHFQNQSSKLVATRGKEVNMVAGDSDDALVCCVENTVEDRIMDSGASFHATYCKDVLERFKLRSGKVRLADDKTLDIVGIGDVVLKTFFGTSWTLEDVRIGMNMLASKGNILDVWKVARWFGEAEESFLHNVSEDKETAETASGVVRARGFKAESTRIRVEAPKMLWADSVSTTYLIYRIPYVLIGLRILREEWRGKDTSLTHSKVFGYDLFVKVKDVCGEAMKYTFIGNSLDEMRYSFRDTKSHQVIRSKDITFVDSIYEARPMTDSSSLTKPIQKSQVVLVDIP